MLCISDTASICCTLLHNYPEPHSRFSLWHPLSVVQVQQQGSDKWGSLKDCLPKIRAQAAGDVPEQHDRAQEPVRNTYNRNDDQPRGRGRGRSSGRGRRPQQDETDLLPVLPEVLPSQLLIWLARNNQFSDGIYQLWSVVLQCCLASVYSSLPVPVSHPSPWVSTL